MALTKINNNTLSAITGLPAGVGGKVLQVVHAQLGSAVASTSGTYADVLSASITISSGSKILLISDKSTYGADSSGSIWKGASYGKYLLNNSTLFETSHVGNRDGSEQLHVCTYTRLITGQSAGEHTIKLQHAIVNAGSISTGAQTAITLIEIS